MSHADFLYTRHGGAARQKHNFKKMKKILLSVLALLAFAASGMAQNLPSYVPANGLVGWWPFNGNANDESGNGNNGTVNGATLTADRFGNAGKAYDFNTGNSIALPNGSNIQGNNPRTISFWIKPEIANVATHTIYKGGTNGNGNDFTIWLRKNVGNTYQLYVRRFIDDVLTDSLPIDLNWSHYSIVYDGTVNSNIKYYINGIEHTGRALAGSGLTFNTASTQPEFGHNIDQLGVHRYFDGVMDDIAIYNRALTQQEITALYQGANTSANCLSLPTNLQQGLVGYWPFCGNALDESGNGNNGTVNGATLTTDRFGNAGSAYSFDGLTNYIVVAHKPQLNAFPITIAAWFKIQNSAGRSQWLVSKYPCQSQDGYSLHLNDGKPSGFYFSSSPNSGFINLDPFTNSFNSYDGGIWHQYSIVLNQNKYVQYLDGDSVRSGTTFNGATGSQTTTLENLFFGKYPGQCNQGQPSEYYYLKGSLDDIAIWNRALTPQEIQQVYNQGICQTSITVTDTLLIHTGITSYNPVAYGNTLKVWPNPGNTAITLDAGNLSLMQGWKIKISNSLGQEVYPATLISQQQQVLSMSTWGGNGLYLLHLINPQGHITEVKKIVLAP
jgi:hypothetical protein